MTCINLVVRISKGRIIKYLYLKLTKITVRFSDYYSVSNKVISIIQ